VVLAFAQEEITRWQISLVIGLVVLLAVFALLTVLLRIVRQIDVNVAATWEMAKRVAANTATTWQLHGTAAGLEELKKEALLHDELLASKL
jgi:hypothetical protein